MADTVATVTAAGALVLIHLCNICATRRVLPLSPSPQNGETPAEAGVLS